MTINLERVHNRVYQNVQKARNAGLPATLTVEEWIDTIDLFNGLCAYCRDNTFEVLDHMVPIYAGGGTTKQNCVPACITCNAYKAHKKGEDVSQITNLIEAAKRTFETLRKARSFKVKR